MNIFLMLSLTVSMPTVLWTVSLKQAYFLGTTILMQFIKTAKEASEFQGDLIITGHFSFALKYQHID